MMRPLLTGSFRDAEVVARTVGQRNALYAVTLAALVVALGCNFARRPDLTLVTFAVAAGLILVGLRRVPCWVMDITDRGLVIRQPVAFRRMLVPWDEIHAVEVHDDTGTIFYGGRALRIPPTVQGAHDLAGFIADHSGRRVGALPFALAEEEVARLLGAGPGGLEVEVSRRAGSGRSGLVLVAVATGLIVTCLPFEQRWRAAFAMVAMVCLAAGLLRLTWTFDRTRLLSLRAEPQGLVAVRRGAVEVTLWRQVRSCDRPDGELAVVTLMDVFMIPAGPAGERFFEAVERVVSAQQQGGGEMERGLSRGADPDERSGP